MLYRLRYTDEARQWIRQAPGNYRQRIRRELEALASNPRPPHAMELREQPGRYRIRLDRWRIIYRVLDDEGIIRVLRVKPRGPGTYEGLDDLDE